MSGGAPLRFGLVGAGRIGETYAAALAGLPAARLVAVADRDPDRASAVAGPAGAVAHASGESMLAAGGLDAVIVCTPPDSHARLSIAAAEAGCHVLCEKPVARTVAEARAMVDTAARAGVRFTMGAKYRFVPEVTRAARLVAAGHLGRLVMVENTFAAPVDMRGRWNADPNVSGGGVLIDNGTHSVDLLRAFAGAVTEVLAVAAPRVQGLPVEDTVRVLARCAGGALGVLLLSWSLDARDRAYLVLHAEGGEVQIGWTGARYRCGPDGHWVHFGDGYDKHAAIRAQVANLIDAVRDRDRLLVGPGDALASVAVIDAAYRSLHTGAWAPVSLEPVGAADAPARAVG